MVEALPGRVDVLVVGAGQAGLAAGHHLARRGLDFAIVDAGDRLGQTWRQRWDSLRLFTPASVSSLPGLPLRSSSTHPSKDETADYLERYAAHFALPVHLRRPATALETHADRCTVHLGPQSVDARHVVVATGAHRRVRIPAFAADLAAGITQLTSASYQHCDQLPAGPVLVVGAGNSGAEIAVDIASGDRAAGVTGRPVLLAGRDVGRIPQLGGPVFRAMRRTPTRRGPGRLVQRLALGAGGDPLGRVDPRQLPGLGVTRVARITGVRDGAPVTADDERLEPAGVVWCTGADPDHAWLPADLPVSGPVEGRPSERPGGGPGVRRVHALGLPYQRTLASHLLGGVGLDAARLVEHLTRPGTPDAATVRT